MILSEKQKNMLLNAINSVKEYSSDWEELYAYINDVNTEINNMEQEASSECWQQIYEMMPEEWQNNYDQLMAEEWKWIVNYAVKN